MALKKKLTDHDRGLIAEAEKVDNCIYWWKIDESRADSIPGREALHRMSSRLYHLEEATIGNL